MIKSLTISIVVLLASMSLFGSKRVDPGYEVGIFQGSDQVSDGVYSSGSGGYGESHDTGHSVHIVSTPEGLYYIQAPVSVGLSMVSSLATDGHAPLVHKQWFMDDLHEGDQVLFSATCDKHGNCMIRLPNPENPQKVIKTLGHFKPVSTKTNINGLCGTGKLTHTAETQLCTVKE